MTCRPVRILVLLTAVGVGQGNAQGLPGTNLSAGIRVRAVVVSGDTSTIAYSLTTSAASRERLASFSVLMATTPVAVIAPAPDSLWGVLPRAGGLPAAQWQALIPVPRGDSTPTLITRVIGLPGIQVAYYQGDSLPVLSDADSLMPDYDNLKDLSRRTLTVGVVAHRPGGIDTHVAWVRTLSDSACTLGWIRSAALCARFRSFTTSGVPSQQVLRFEAALDSAYTHGSQVSEAACRMLMANLEYIEHLMAGAGGRTQSKAGTSATRRPAGCATTPHQQGHLE